MQSPGTISIQIERKLSVRTQVLFISMFAVLTAVGAQIEIPHQPVPYTLQTFFVLLAGALLGKKNGALSQIVYLVAGLSGLPAFSGFGFGIARLLGPTGGYLLAFPVAAFVVGYIIEGRETFMRTLMAMCVGLFVVFSLGTLQLNYLVYHDWAQAIGNGFLIFSWWDVLKVGAAATAARQLRRRLP